MKPRKLMKKAISALPTALATASLTLLLASCGAGDGGNANTARPTGSAATDAPDRSAGQKEQQTGEQSVQTEADLEAVTLRTGDLAEFPITWMPILGSHVTAVTRPAACRPVESVRMGAFDPRPRASVRRYAAATTGEHLGSATSITLAAFSKADAVQIMAELRDAVKDCTGDYDGGWTDTFTVRGLDPVDAGEQAVSFHLTGKSVVPMWYTVVRQGSVLVLFASTTLTGKDGQVPTPLVTRQITKLQAAASG
ncbi:hypothetical protein [Streptomyces xantholiticus]|uniref:PknH-like extracellular domain-containing protein n=1 Tax=Streptomyces xantholiticus TaxID=68285 RepID=A0ABV1V4Q7_9ACTN